MAKGSMMAWSWNRWAGIAGIAAATGYLVGDILLLGNDRHRDRHPVLKETDIPQKAPELLDATPRQLTVGALAGVLTSPLQLGGYASLYSGLRPAGLWGATVPTALLTGAWTYASYMHGSFLAYGSSDQLLDEHLRDDSPQTPDVRENYLRIERALFVVYPFFLSATAAGSALIFYHVARGRTDFPRWSAPLVSPAVTIAASGAAELAITRCRDTGAPLRGAGLSLGHVVTFITTTILRWNR